MTEAEPLTAHLRLSQMFIGGVLPFIATSAVLVILETHVLADYNYVPDLPKIGPNCTYYPPGAKPISGSCVTVDSNGHNLTCAHQNGFFMSGLCSNNVTF
jgi:hypothetical protein